MIPILYEDNHILVVIKPANMLVQGDTTKDLDMVTLLKKYLKEKYQKPGNVYLGLVHRLDRVVEGVMVFAKTSKAAARLSKQVANHEMEKIYYAVVLGNLKGKGHLENYLQKDSNLHLSYVKDTGKLAILDYESIGVENNLSLIKINLKTGRHHQIRVQFSHFGYPLYGDQKYNPDSKPKEQIALVAKELTFTHPVTKERMHFSISLPNRYPYTLFKTK